MQKRCLRKILLGVLAIYLCLASSAAVASNDRSEAMIAGELSTLATAIDNLARQLQSQAGSSQQDIKLRKLDIAVAYLNFRSRRIEMVERDLQAARTNRNRLDDVWVQFQREEENLSRSFDANQEEAVQRAREELKFRRQAVKDRISRMEEEIILLENRLMDMQSQIDSVESYVQKNLEF